MEKISDTGLNRKYYKRRYGLNDLIDDKHPLFRKNRVKVKLDSYKDLLGEALSQTNSNTVDVRKMLVRRVVRLFFKYMFEDLIFNNEVFIFPYRQIKLLIGINFYFLRHTDVPEGMKPFKRKRVEFNYETEGLDYALRFFVTKKYMKRLKVYIYASFMGKYKKIFNDEVKKGHRYSIQETI